MSMRWELWAAAAAAACWSCVGDSDIGVDAGDAGGGDATLDVTGSDAVTDAPTSADVIEEEAAAPPTYNDVTNAANWSTFSMPTGTEAFLGGAFDGRYVYFVPATSGVVARYDTTQSFTLTDRHEQHRGHIDPRLLPRRDVRRPLRLLHSVRMLRQRHRGNDAPLRHPSSIRRDGGVAGVR